MFERYITDALTTHFGHILENVDSDKMRLSAWDGELTLEDVAIKTTALNTILGGQENSPIEIAYGHIGAFRLKIPWSLLSGLITRTADVDGGPPTADGTSATAAISVVLTDVDILITPRRKIVVVSKNDDGESDMQDEKTSVEIDNDDTPSEMTLSGCRARKERKVQSLLDANLFKRVTESSILAAETEKVERGSLAAWIQEKLAEVLSNLSITVKNIHIRYEDPGTSMGFDWRYTRRDLNTTADLVNQNSKFSLNSNAFDYSPLRSRTLGSNIIGGKNRSNNDGIIRSQRFRPSFAVGITLKEFSVQSTIAPTQRQESPEVDENNSESKNLKSSDETTIFVASTTASVSTSTDVAKSTTATSNFKIRRQHKRAAANELAIYWDSATTLISERAMLKFQLQSYDQLQKEENAEDIHKQQLLKEETFNFYRSCFSIFDKGPTSHLSSTEFCVNHSYLMEPISPSIDLTLISKIPVTSPIKGADKISIYESDDNLSEAQYQSKSEERRATGRVFQSIPPSSIKIELPPCTFTLSRNTLEDTVYLRKSLSVWTDARKIKASESALRRILRLRPSNSAKKDPVGWWKYAFEATKVMTQASLSSEMDDIIEDADIRIGNRRESCTYGEIGQKNQARRRLVPLSRRKGWIGLVEAVSRRREYVKLYKVLLEPPIPRTTENNDKNERQKLRQIDAHECLLKMEDELLAREMVAFRIHAYEYMKEQGVLKTGERGENRGHDEEHSQTLLVSPVNITNSESTKSSKGGWVSWIGSGKYGTRSESITSTKVDLEHDIASAESEQKYVMIKGETDEEMLSIEHRRWMMNEMKEALDREKSNIEDQSRDGTRGSSVIQISKNILLTGDMPNDESNFVVWTASLSCSKFCIQINDQQKDPDNFRKSRSTAPVIRMSSAWVQNQSWFHDGSWNIDITFASMEVIDLISGRGKHSDSRYVSTLLGSKSKPGQPDDESILLINGNCYHRNMCVKIKRRLHWNSPIGWERQKQSIDRGSTTTIQIQVLPMEIVYSALPIETMKRVFLAVKTPEIVDDYHKVLGVAKAWRNKQKEKLLETLAHKNKQIVVNIDITAPELLIPEDIYSADSPMLAINFGRFRAYNDNEELDSKNVGDFDDQWRVLVSNIQVQSTNMASYYSHLPPGLSNGQLVEPFSIDFILSTKFMNVVDDNDSKESSVSVSATLPRLAFNITSSAIRLISRLRQNLAEREREIHGEDFLYENNADGDHSIFSKTRKGEGLNDEVTYVELTRESNDRASRVFKFDFSAPAITLKLENDVDGKNRIDEKSNASTPILDLAFRSIQGSFSQEVAHNGDSVIKFKSKLRSLGVIDLYQNAGKNFNLLVSSVPQNQMSEEINIGSAHSWDVIHASHDANEGYEKSKDLVTLEYCSISTPTSDTDADIGDKDQSINKPDKISLWFHELYVEWNPETFAAVHLAMRKTSTKERSSESFDDSCILPTQQSDGDESSADDEFFDALEEELYDESGSDNLLALSEISTSTDNIQALGNQWTDSSPPHGTLSSMNKSQLSPMVGTGLLNQGRLALSPGSRSSFGIGQFHSARMYESSYFDTLKIPKIESESGRTSKSARSRQIEIVFKLSKLRVSFNKETRNRKIVIAQMDRTFVSYSTKVTGGSIILMNLGNLVFIDPSHEENKTLYGQILGLQTKTKGVDENSFSSLLEMEVIMNPKERTYSSSLHSDRSDTVVIDRERGKMAGSNCCVTAKFSPMRFVLIEQLWMEFMDYFFQGIIGNEVLGGQTKKTTPGSPLDSFRNDLHSNFVLGSDANGISFTRFDISLDSPVIIFPVTYSSPDYLRMKLSKICLLNEYDGTIVTDTASIIDGEQINRMQWFNNCKVLMDDLRLYSWTGRELSRNSVNACISLRWPTGPLAPLIIPKWHVHCTFDLLDISLCQSDYALLQNILSYNIGEPSRHMDEWLMLQTLSQNALDDYMQRIIVHYGYDKKNVAPSTYNVKLSVSSLQVRFLEADTDNSDPLAIARCFDLEWQMKKKSDLIVKQNVSCGIDLVRPTREKSGFETLMTISKDNNDFDGEEENKDRALPDFIYSSTSFPNGDNVKTIQIFDPCIYLIVPAWSQFASFFQSLSSPIFLSEKEIGESIQVGDRWYRIGGNDNCRPSNLQFSSGMGNEGKKKFSWISSDLTSATSAGLPRKLSLGKGPPALQIKLLLTWPRIILSSVTTEEHPMRVILRMNHVEFLQTDDRQNAKKTRSFFLHDVEVYTTAQKMSTHSISNNEENNSLIRPWNVSAVAITQNEYGVGDFEQHTYKICGDILRARAAYSDMSIAIDVFLSVLHTANEIRNISAVDDLPQHSKPIESLMMKSSTDQDGENKSTKCSINLYDIECNGFELKVADDSGRHFSGFQDLAILSIGKTLFSRHEAKNGRVAMKLWLDCLDLFDCLQPINSPFRNAASSRSKVMRLSNTADHIKLNESSSSNLNVDIPRKMAWKDFAAEYDGSKKFQIPESFWQKVNETSRQCAHYLWGEGGEGPTPGLIEIACTFTDNHSQEYDIRFRKFAVQWNPSTVIAIQRFLGRLRKESKLIAGQVFHNQFDDSTVESIKEKKSQSGTDSGVPEASSLIRANIQIDSLTICMNKEHQNRRLLELTLSSCNVVMHSSEQGSTINGQIGDLSAFDNDNYTANGLDQDFISKKNRKVLSVLKNDATKNSEKFLQIQYRTFTKKATSASKADVPDWIKSNLPSVDDIDDFLSLTIAGTYFTYLKERTEELLDYLSNGLPGKGMGVTSRAAKGFISRRIQTRSFLQLRVKSPQIFVPQHEMVEEGLGLKLGDVNVQSWFEEAPSNANDYLDSEWWRVLSLKLSGFSYGIIRTGSNFESLSSATNPLDLDILLRKPTIKGRTLSIRGKMSSFEGVLNYDDYALLQAVTRDNIGRHVNTEKWDNVEKAYWLENDDVDQRLGYQGAVDGDLNKKVVYSTNARFVRYGKSGKKGTKQVPSRIMQQTSAHQSEKDSVNTLDIRFDMAGVALKLRRNDLPGGIVKEDDIATAFHYNIMLLRVGVVEVSTTANAAGDVSFNLSLFRIGLFDLGDSGRLIRQRYYYSLSSEDVFNKKKVITQPCPFFVLAEGYLSIDDNDVNERGASDLKGPEVVISIDKCRASSTNGFLPRSETALPPDTKVTVAKIVINYLSFNAFIRPFREIADFLACAWPIPSHISTTYHVVDKSELCTSDKNTFSDDKKFHDSLRGFQLKVVANYPRIFFLADESDLNSRALVLKGLAVANISIVNKREISGPRDLGAIDIQKITSVGAQLHSLETYINPDVSATLRFRQRHSDMVGKGHLSSVNLKTEDEVEEKGDTLGVALIQPVTIGIEYTKSERDLFPTRRSLQINIDPVSTMLSFEDLQLVEIVLKRWSSDKSNSSEDISSRSESAKEPERESRVYYEVVFETSRLGLGLRTEGNRVIINAIQNPVYNHKIHEGDILVLVGDKNVSNMQLEQIVKILARSERPIVVGFERIVKTAPSLKTVDSLEKKNKLKSVADDDEALVDGYPISCYNVYFRSGMQLGLVFEKNVCGEFPVVSQVLSSIDKAVILSGSVDQIDSEQIEVIDSVFNSENKRLPRVGAVVVAVDDIPVEELGVEQVWQILSRIQDFEVPHESMDSDIARGSTFSLTFQETHSSTWGNIDTMEVSLAGMTLSFIDDLNGRDMPLFRGKLSSVGIHIERGLGINAHILDRTIPSLLIPIYSDYDDENSEVLLSINQVQDIQTESIISFSAICTCSVDYFRSRISFWEPILEPSRLFFHFEKQEGSIEANRPSQLAFEVSDRLLHNRFTRATFDQNNDVGEANMVSVNLTDAAAEVFFEAFTRWKDWRKNIRDTAEAGTERTRDAILEEGCHPSGSDASIMHMVKGNSRLDSEAIGNTHQHLTQQAAAKKAAQRALIFAQKRGAETSKKSDSAKPFILRNRTGISIAFVQQGHGIRNDGYAGRSAQKRGERSSNFTLTIGEYDGLEEYKQESITELADQEEAKFNMDIIDENFGEDTTQRRSTRKFSNKIRSYEGRYPDLMVAIQAVAGISVQPITNLQVFKVGSTIRDLTVKKDNDSFTESGSTRNSIRVVWSVEIEDNRRILTLSTAVRVVSSGLNMPIEIGFRYDGNNNKCYHNSEDSINTIGISRSDRPFYMPLWLALKLEPVSIYVRPTSTCSVDYLWSELSVLRFGLFLEERMIADDRRQNALRTERWTWEQTFPGLRCICCRCSLTENYPTWFSVFGSSSNELEINKTKDDVFRERIKFDAFEELSIILDSGLSIRNMLPAMIEMEVIQGDELSTRSRSCSKKNTAHFSFDEVEPDVSKFGTLKCGECTEVFEVNFTDTIPKLRIKHESLKGWSNWAPLKLNETPISDENDEGIHRNEITAPVLNSPSQINIQIPGIDFGIPMTIGVRVEPKMTNDDTTRGSVYGLEVIIYAELWIRNITSLPLNFGCPVHQIYEPENTLTISQSDDSIAKFTAESALMELTSLLEVGDKGIALNQKVAVEDLDRSHVIESLPGQQCSELTEEVFEYVEIESSMVKRKWWASESYDGYHKQIFDVGDTEANWKWIDEKWSIDCSGGAKPSVGGWESCRSLCTRNESFGKKREFSPSHGYRRRRFFRRRIAYLDGTQSSPIDLLSRNSSFSLSGCLGGVQVFHQPIMDAFTREQKKIERNRNKETSKSTGHGRLIDEKLKISIRCGDGTWSSSAEISDAGTCFGVIQALASRWPRLTQRQSETIQSNIFNNDAVKRNSYSNKNPTQNCDFKPGCLTSDLYEFCYTVSEIDGEWGEFSRCMEVSPRFIVRNDSKVIHMKVKQAGAPNSTCVTLKPGKASPFYWADFRLPKLVSVIPFDSSDTNVDKFKWSGGFDLCNLGMTPVRIRDGNSTFKTGLNNTMVTSIRVLVEVRPGSGGHGINVSLREEMPNGNGSLFRIENLSPLPIWLLQDGVLANPVALTRNTVNSNSFADGDLMPPNSKSTFALDVPYRQGKYSHRKEASLSELMHVRVALAPLSSRAGIETVKVVGLATMGEIVRLNPKKLPSKLSSKGQDILQSIRVLGVVATDGPTRVLRFCLMAYPMSDPTSRNPIPDTSFFTTTQGLQDKSLTTASQRDYTNEITSGISEAMREALTGDIPTEEQAKRKALFADLKSTIGGDVEKVDGGASDIVFSFRIEFSGFVFSLVDSAPSEIALASLRNINVLARWNNLRSTDATLLLSVGWLQIDNHIPSAPFKVAVRPDISNQEDEQGPEPSPLLVVAVAFAPEHKSKIVVVRSVTVAPRDLVIALDLAFLVRLQRFFMGLRDYIRRSHQDTYVALQHTNTNGILMEQKKVIAFPNFVSPQKQLEQIADFSENKKMYFQGLTILPTNIKLSVAPAKALTFDQASLEGKEAALIHAAVRKGDVLVGGKSTGPLGVRVGRKNRTPLAVVRGVFKSIVVDALLRLSGASLNFHGVFLRNYISTSTQLSTYLAAHYLSSLKYNVPALLGSLSAIGNPLGLIRGIGDGVSDFVIEPMKGFKRALQELDPGYAVDGVARGTESLARHTVGGIADSASLLMETFSKYMAVVTLDRRYAQKRDRRKSLRLKSDAKVTLVGGVESGFLKLVQGFREGVTGVVRAPIRGAEKRGLEGFAKGIGKGLLGLLVKPIIGITDAATDVMIGVKSTVEYKGAQRQNLALLRNQFRPRRPMYGRDKVLRPYSMEDAAAATLMLKTRCAGENYLSHMEMNDRVALLSIKRLIILGPKGEELLALKFSHVDRLEVRSIRQEDGITEGWGIIVLLNTPRRNGSDVEVISCRSEQEAMDLRMLIQGGVDLASLDSPQV